MYYTLAWYSVCSMGRFVKTQEMMTIIKPMTTINAMNAAVVPFQNPSVFMK